ncbi:MAG TPA: hypothetical protein VMJ72_00030 [Candidatus Paceibacterota bacterium]|nr:hypothetical protein [Candidatus Paceibacterota bacterium]
MHPRIRTHAAVATTITWPAYALAFIAAACLVYYIVQANLLAADTWRLRAAQDTIASLKTERDELTASQAQLDDRTSLEAIATAHGLIPAEHVERLVQPDAVAAAR